ELAERLLRRSRDAGLAQAVMGLSSVSEARGQRQEAVAQLAEGLILQTRDLPPGSAEAIARGVFGDVRARDQAPALVQRHLANPAQGLAWYGPIRADPARPAHRSAGGDRPRAHAERLLGPRSALATVWPRGSEAGRVPRFLLAHRIRRRLGARGPTGPVPARRT